MNRKTPATLRADASHLRALAADMLVKADTFDRQADAIDGANGELVRQWFEYVRAVRAAS